MDNKLKLKLNQPLLPELIDIDGLKYFTDGFTIVEEILPDYEDNISLIPKVKVDNTFLFPADFDNSQSPIDRTTTDYKSQNNLLSDNDELNRKLERQLVSGSLLSVQPNIDYQKTTTDLSSENDDTGFGNFVHFSSAERRLRNFKKKLELIEGHTATSHSLESITGATTRIQEIERKRQRV